MDLDNESRFNITGSLISGECLLDLWDYPEILKQGERVTLTVGGETHMFTVKDVHPNWSDSGVTYDLEPVK